jgi:hypothetical protein
VAWAASKYLQDNGGEVLEGYSTFQAVVFVRLAYHVNEYELDQAGQPNSNYGWAWPSVARLAGSHPTVSQNTVRHTLRLGVSSGLIFTDGKSYRNTIRYRFPAVHPFNNSEGVEDARSLQKVGATPSKISATPSKTGVDPFTSFEPEVKEVGEVKKGSRAGARGPRSSDLGLTVEEIAERNRLDLEFRRRQEAKATATATAPTVVSTTPSPEAQARLDAIAERHAREDAALDARREAEDAARLAGAASSPTKENP